MADTDERAAKRAERQVATLFTLSIIGTLVFLVSYFAVDPRTSVVLPGIGSTELQHVLLGAGLGFGLFFIGIGAVHWAKTLMPDTEVIEERHPLRSSDEDRAGALETLREGNEGSGLGRRPLIKLTLGGALGLFGLPFIVALRDLGPLPGDAKSHTFWKANTRLVTDVEQAPIKASDVTIGSVYHVMTRAEQVVRGLHARGLPRRPVRADHAPPALPVSPVHLRRHAGLQGHLRSRPPQPAPADDHRQHRRVPHREGGLLRVSRPELS